MIDHPKNITYDQDDKWKSLCRHEFCWNAEAAKVQTINQLETILYSANPTLMRYRKAIFQIGYWS